MSKVPFIPAPAEGDDAQRFIEALERHSNSMIGVLDAAIALRTAPPHVQRARHKARGHLEDFCQHAKRAFDLNHQTKKDEDNG